jgi:hypothetical protein
MLIDFFMRGCIGYIQGGSGHTLVDFALPSNGKTYVFVAGWWMDVDDITPGQEVAVFDAMLTPTVNGRMLDLPGQRFVMEPSEDVEVDNGIASMRAYMDIERSAYVGAVRSVAARFKLEQVEVDQWIDAVTKRPALAPDELLRQAERLPRKVATIQLANEYGEIVDAVAVDERGAAASALGTPKGEWLANLWPPTIPGEPGLFPAGTLDPEGFVNYYATRSVYGGGAWVNPTATVAPGLVSLLAAASLPATLAT